MIDTSQQKMVLLHAGGGTGKTLKIFDKLFMRGEICCCTCPTGVGASHLPQGHTFHSVFKMWTPDLSTRTAIDEIQTSLGGSKLKIIVFDEVSMLSTQFLVLLDSRLRAMYKPEKPFGSISIPIICQCISVLRPYPYVSF
jgi:hypothetical protein